MAKVLIVDDSRTSRKMLRSLLEEAGYEIAGEAVNGDEGYLKVLRDIEQQERRDWRNR